MFLVISFTLGDGAPVSTAAPGEPLPEACTPAFDRGLAGEPWQGEQAAASEAVYQEHAGETAGLVVEGLDGQWFLGDANHDDLSQALGREPLSPERLDAWHAYVNNMRADLAAVDVPLYLVVAPAKWELMPETLPAWSQELRGEVRLDQLMAAHPDLPFVDVRAAMGEAEATAPAYSPRSSHWTPWGAQAAFGTIAACLAATGDAPDDVAPPATSGATTIPDVDELAQLGAPPVAAGERSIPVYADAVPQMTVSFLDGTSESLPASEGIDMTRLPAWTSTPDAPIDLDVLVVGDSTTTALGPALQSTFAETTQIRHQLDDPAAMPDVAVAAQDSGADVAILLVTERYLDIVPGVVEAP